MYENSRCLKNRFTFCGVNTNFGQQWAPPAYYHLTPIVSKGKHWDLKQKQSRVPESIQTILALVAKSHTESHTGTGFEYNIIT